MNRQKHNADVLIVFSNPADSIRLRLDREQRTLQELESKYRSDGVFRVLAATTVADLMSALRQPLLRIVHFSGHGSPKGIYLESSDTDDAGLEMSADRLLSLITSHCPQLEALILASCYSAETSTILRHAAPFVITVEGPADDNAAITFSRHFYDNYLDSGSIEKSLLRTQIELQSLDCDKGLQIYVTRRGDELAKSRLTLQSIKQQFDQETLLIDVTDVDAQIGSLDIPRGAFLALLANKIYVHRWLPFSVTDMEYAVFPIGKYFAVFSWRHGMDVILCRRLLQPRPEATEQECWFWMSLSFQYNQLFALTYRRERAAVYAGMNAKLQFALALFQECIDRFFCAKSLTVVRSLIPDQLKMAVPLILENFRTAERAFHSEDYPKVVVHLETTLSLVHGVLDGLVDALAMPIATGLPNPGLEPTAPSKS